MATGQSVADIKFNVHAHPTLSEVRPPHTHTRARARTHTHARVRQPLYCCITAHQYSAKSQIVLQHCSGYVMRCDFVKQKRG